MKRFLRILLALTVLFLAYVGITLLLGTLGDWQPPASEEAEVVRTSDGPDVITDSVISLALWNIGYAGLGEESDFFFDNGGFFTAGDHMVRPPQAYMEKNIAGARLFTSSTQADFFLFQEVDRNSKRSYFIDQGDTLANQRPDYAAAFAANYQVSRVPLPILTPWKAYGKVRSGLLTLSKWQPTQQTRYQLPGDFPWPDRIFQLDRCLLESRFKTSSGKELVVINAHLSAYDKGGTLKKQQMAFLQEFVQAEYAKGNYVIVGADWNQCPPYFEFDRFMPGQSQGYTQTTIAEDFLPGGWQWLYDASLPTNRKLRAPLDDYSFRTLIDFYLVSPNIRAKRVKTLDQQFRFSDHQPVWVQVELL
ncbi:MAG: endonuclease/exonuclease/phosphatase family protein [Bacteroidota bacterium]